MQALIKRTCALILVLSIPNTIYAVNPEKPIKPTKKQPLLAQLRKVELKHEKSSYNERNAAVVKFINRYVGLYTKSSGIVNPKAYLKAYKTLEKQINAPAPCGETLLIWTVRKQLHKVRENLLKLNLDIDISAQDQEGKTIYTWLAITNYPLHTALKYAHKHHTNCKRHCDLADILNSPDTNGRTPLSYVTMPPAKAIQTVNCTPCGDLNTIKKNHIHTRSKNMELLKKSGARDDIIDKSGLTPKKYQQTRSRILELNEQVKENAKYDTFANKRSQSMPIIQRLPILLNYEAYQLVASTRLQYGTQKAASNRS